MVWGGMKRILPLLVVALAAAGLARAAPAPRLGVTSFAQLATPLPYPYDETVDANRTVAAALAKARAHHKLLLVDLGGNWCGDCRILAATMELPALKAFVTAHYEVVLVDVGHFDKNGQIPARYGITGRLEGVPALLIIDPRTNRLVDAGHIAALADARHMDPQSLADWLAQWTS
jgi:thiol-disulfide isomerase/thioredoxin